MQMSRDEELRVMNFCSACGARVARVWVPADARERTICEACGITHYVNPRIVVSCAVCWGERVLMCRRSHEPARGKWVLPSGYLECGETLEEAAARETFEEAGVRVDPASLDLSFVLNLANIDQVIVGFRIVVTEPPEPKPGPEALEVGFLAESEIPQGEFAWRSVMGPGPLQFYRELGSKQFSVRLVTPAAHDAAGPYVREYRIDSIVRKPGGRREES